MTRLQVGHRYDHYSFMLMHCNKPAVVAECRLYISDLTVPSHCLTGCIDPVGTWDHLKIGGTE